jgi:hypothetical protein
VEVEVQLDLDVELKVERTAIDWMGRGMIRWDRRTEDDSDSITRGIKACTWTGTHMRTAQNHLIRYIWYHKFVELELSSKLEAESSASHFVVKYVCA